MTVSKDLFLSILSMDSYNRGYAPGIEGLSDDAGTMVGSAAIQDQDLPANYQAASFFAISYTIGSGVDGISPGTIAAFTVELLSPTAPVGPTCAECQTGLPGG